MGKLKLSRILLVAAILLIVAFQSYWLIRLYKEERDGLKKETNGIFRDVVYNMQVDRFKQDTMIFRKTSGNNLFVYNAVNAIRVQNKALKKKLMTGNSEAAQTEDLTFDTIKPMRVEIRKHSFGAEIQKMNASDHQGNTVKLPPMMDTALLQRMSQSGINVVLKISGKNNDTSISLQRNTVMSQEIISHPNSNIIVRNFPLEKKNTITLDAKGGISQPEKAIIRILASGKALDDTLPVKKLDSVYKKELQKAGINIDFYIKKGKDDSLHRKDTISSALFTTQPATVGFIQPIWYQAGFENPTAYLLKKISLQILFSLFLIAFTSVTFIFLYRNLVAQRKLTEMKNDFISNITHELKTPLATVSVAVEALRSFGGIQNPERTKEYLDISAAELQRLSLLVDKVLKLSLFENRELELKKEWVDLKPLTEEVLNTMKLQFEAHRAKVALTIDGQGFSIFADRLHITSVIFNLLDNALKYSKENPEINIRLYNNSNEIVLEVADKGIGIASDFKTKIFDKFFRVPNGDHHNIKGYGLGLSYVSHVIKRHGGTISVESEPGKGSLFTVKFPTA